jgi:hypothetical protein
MLVTNAYQANIPTTEGAYTEGWQIYICYTDDEMAELLANYDEASGTSPSVTYCRPTVREILDAVKLTGQS